VTVHKADITRLEGKSIYLSDGSTLQTDILIYATGYAHHEPIFSVEDSYSLGLATPISHLSSLEPDMESRTKRAEEMDKVVLERFPRLVNHPSIPGPPTYTQHRLYRSILPLSLLEKQDRSLAFVGYLQGAGICVIADVSALWCVAWMTGNLDVKREKKEIEWEVDYLNAFMRKRWGRIGKEAPVSTFEWGSVCSPYLFRYYSILTWLMDSSRPMR
jgi:dimethylaniline monooxygenase (N-oxide forming)